MNYPEAHCHKWAWNLGEARGRHLAAERAWAEGSEVEAKQALHEMYYGDFEQRPLFPGLKILSSFWIAECAEMRFRLRVLHQALNGDALECASQDLFDTLFKEYRDDAVRLAEEGGLLGSFTASEFIRGYEPGSDLDDWPEELERLKLSTDEGIGAGKPGDLYFRWSSFCIKAVLSYAANLIRQAILAGLYVRRNGVDALEATLKPTYESFGWDVNRLFYGEVLAQMGIADLNDLVDLGTYGMLADQQSAPPREWKEGDGQSAVTFKESYLLTCQLYGIYSTVERRLGLEPGALAAAYCPYCVGHGEKTMFLVVPPDQRPIYTLVEGLAYDGNKCSFRLRLEPADDMARVEEAQMRIFGRG